MDLELLAVSLRIDRPSPSGHERQSGPIACHLPLVEPIADAATERFERPLLGDAALVRKMAAQGHTRYFITVAVVHFA